MMNQPPAPLVHVLLAEDEVLAAMAIEDALSRAGFRVTVALNGQLALEADAKDQADVLLTDLRMPVMGGMELIRHLRDSRPHLPVVVVTGTPPEGGVARIQADDPGQTILLVKPTSIDNLTRAIRQLIGKA